MLYIIFILLFTQILTNNFNYLFKNEIYIYIFRFQTIMSWSVVESKHKSSCLKKNIKECWISKAVKTTKISINDYDILNNLNKVPVHNNAILSHILATLPCICKKHIINKKYYVCPDNKYIVIIKDIKNNTITLEQWTCHYDKVMQLTPIAVRKVCLCL